MVFRPTDHSFAIHAVLASGTPGDLTASVRPFGEPAWSPPLAPEQIAADVVQWSFDGLAPTTRYVYQISRAAEAGAPEVVYAGTAVTSRRAGDTFAFALISDSHIGPDFAFTNQGDWCTLVAVSEAVGAASPDFVINLGDMLDFHQFGFNEPPPDVAQTRQAYRNYRVMLGSTLGNAAHFPAIGNWEGEDGWFAPEDIARSRQVRIENMPGPLPTTYPQAGSNGQDYYAFTWGDALFIVLNVMSYTPSPHLLSAGAGLPDDWTLGPEQMQWLANTLAQATSKWRFLLIHHPVGGAAGTAENSAYGRGGGQAAYVGEQAVVHQLMLAYGVQIFFYGHDHVFTDMTVDGIHYSEPSNAGARWMFVPEETGYSQSWSVPGWAHVVVSPAAVDVTYLAKTGEVIYGYQVR
jgi:3',5'-cyclic AMP phosphodiesterase CpdA